jgi:hypothetical protein
MDETCSTHDINEKYKCLFGVVERLTFLLRIPEVPFSNNGSETGYPD